MRRLRVPSATAVDWVIRATTEAEWRSLRDTRLEALTDTPNVFGTRLTDAIEYSEDYWRERANGEGSFRFFLAWAGPKPIGIAGPVSYTHLTLPTKA